GYFAFAFAGFAAPAINIETEMFRFVSADIRKFLGSEKVSYVIIRFNIGNRVAPAGTANWVLIDKFDAFDGVEIALYFRKLSGLFAVTANFAKQCGVKDFLHQST